jgi:hypothetical protein
MPDELYDVTREIITPERDDDGLFVQPDDESPERETVEQHNRDRFANHFKYADVFTGLTRTFDDKGDYNCGRCNMANGDKCLLVGSLTIDRDAGSCGDWENRCAGDAEMPLGDKTIETAGYGVAANGKGFGCHRCPFASKAHNPDSRGRDLYCGKGDMRVFAMACCGLNGAETLPIDEHGHLKKALPPNRSQTAMSDMKKAVIQPRELHDVAAFDLGTADAQGEWVVYKDSTLFKPGSYDSHNFAMSPDEMAAVPGKITGPIRNELEHINTLGTATIIDDQLGDVTDVRLSTDGSELKGTVKIPRWLDQVWDKHLAKAGGSHKQVSCVWDRMDKTLLKLGLVVKGRVPGAALMAAFSEAHPEKAAVLFAGDKTYQGQSTLQSIHDTSAACGATCSKTDSAKMHAAPELEAIQRVHDKAVKAGAVCRFMDDDRPRMFADRRIKHPDKTVGMQAVHNIVGMYPGVCATEDDDDDMDVGFAAPTSQHKALRTIHSLSVEHGADCPGKPKSAKMSTTPPQTGIAGRNPVKHEIEIRRAMFGDKADTAPPLTLTDEQAEKVFAVLVPVASFADNPQAKALAEKVERLEKREEETRKASALKDAARFAEALAKEGRIDPFLKTAVAALAIRLSDDDHATPATVTFSDKDGKPTEGPRIDALFALFAAMPKRTHDVPTIADLEADSLEDRWKVRFNTGHTPAKKDGEMTVEAEDALLALYPTGPAIIAARKGSR